jgi:cellulose synthase/poly-beta-1,6-N-acetylglucosamine synthase-like glycosyltransferase
MSGAAGLIAVVVAIGFVLLLVPIVVFAVEVFAARLGATQADPSPPDTGEPTPDRTAPAHQLAVLIPAHDEAAGIAATLLNLRSQLAPGDRMVVVADNCSDATAAVAAANGAEVIERSHATLRGKSYALDFGMQHLALNPPSVMAIVDADCTLAPHCMQRLVAACVRSGQPAQALYLMDAPAGAPLRIRVAAFAWRVKNWVRPLGVARMGGACPLMGSGMVFPWAVISRMPLASGHLAEDIKLGMELARVGSPARFVPGAQVHSVFPLTTASASSQRARWEHGHLAMILSDGLPSLLRAVARRDATLMAMAIDLMVPPLTLLLGLTLLSVLLGLALAPWLGRSLIGISGVGLVVLLAALLRAWWLVGRPLLSVNDLVRAPAYALWKIPLYLKFVTQRQKEWVRTKRHDEKP